MGIQRIQQSGFAQISNGMLRDDRLSWRARGLLAFVLSHADGINAPRDWLVKQSSQDGEFVVRSILRELDSLGYRRVQRVRDEKGLVTTVVEWFQYPNGDPSQIPNRVVGFPPGGLTHQ